MPPARQNRLTTPSKWSLRMNQIVMPPKIAASPRRSIVESRNAPYLPELPLMRASWPSSMSVKVKIVAVKAPGNSSPIGNRDSAAADMQTVPATVIMFGVTGVRASPCTIGLNRRAKKGRRKFSMAEKNLSAVLLAGGRPPCCTPALWLGLGLLWALPRTLRRPFVVIWALPDGFSPWVLW
jgi:hypothetical protein